MNAMIKFFLLLVLALLVLGTYPTLGASLSPQNQLAAVDHHARSFKYSSVEFPPLEGSVSTTKVYTTKIKLGTPPLELTVQVDTGSSDFWVSCIRGPAGTNRFYDMRKSSTAKLYACSNDSKYCNYSVTYVDGTGSVGYLVEDVLHIGNTSARVIFGCGTNQSGDLALGLSGLAYIDGILGLGPGRQSLLHQWSSKGVAPPAFAHCLTGGGNEGGSLVIGKVALPGVVYTPLVPSLQSYIINLQGIKVNGISLQLDPSLFKLSSIDSGATYAYLPHQAYKFLTSTIKNTLPKSVGTTSVDEFPRCYVIYNSTINTIFPPIKWDFAGGASMIWKPKDYLLKKRSNVTTGGVTWCLGIQISGESDSTIIGEIGLTDKIVSYDLGNEKVGWFDFDCSKSINVSSQYSKSPSKQVPMLFKTLLMCTLVFVIMDLV